MGNLGVIIPAAGKGTRMGTAESKQYLPLGDRPVLVHTLQLFQDMAEVTAIILVVSETEQVRCHQLVQQYQLSKVSAIIIGDSERQSSVYQGLLACPKELEWILIHDAVRPFVSQQKITQCWHKAMDTGAAVLAVPVKDTIKVVGSSGQIEHTPDRKSLWAIQTPQAFRLSLLREAHEKARMEQFIGTDDAMLVERLGTAVHVVEGAYENIKITTPEDLTWAAWKLKYKGEEKQ